MKNILAENMIRFGTKNLSESAKLILTEQDQAYWDALLQGKQVADEKIDLPSVPLIDPSSGKQVTHGFLNDTSVKRPVYVGVQATAQLDISRKPGDGRFRSWIYFYITFKPNEKISASDSTKIFITVLQTLTASNKISSVTSDGKTPTTDPKERFYFGRTDSLSMLRAYIMKDVSGWTNKTMFDNLNSKLAQWGLPTLPNDLYTIAG
jgi:hypothetical protein